MRRIGLRLGFVSGFVGLAVAVGLAWRQEPAPVTEAEPSLVVPGDAGADVVAVPSSSPRASLPALPRSLRGTEVPGGFVVDATGRFRATPDALDLFDYFFSASGEEPHARIVERIEAEILTRLSSPARQEALRLLDSYVRYREEARALFEAGLEELPVEVRFQRIRELRRGVFGAGDAERLFGDEEDRIRVELERRRVAQDPTLTPEERASRLAALAEQLPARVREARSAARVALELRQDEARLRAEGGGQGELRALRERRFGPAAAERLAALDREREAWRERLEEWRAARERLEREFAGEPRALAAATARARAERFSEAERRRVEAIEALEAASEGR